MLSNWHSAWNKVLKISAFNNCLCYNFAVFLLCPFALPPGLRKLEAFFGCLITIMALTFGYEVGSQSRNTPDQDHPSLCLLQSLGAGPQPGRRGGRGETGGAGGWA